jgi:hypothetical protein
MQLLEMKYLIEAESRQRPDIWYAAAKVRLSSTVRRRLRIEEDVDDLGPLFYAYLEAEEIAISFLRYKVEPPGVFILQIDAPSVVSKRKVGVFSFITATFAAMKITPDNIVWINKDLNEAFPAPRLRTSQIDDFVRAVEMDISVKGSAPATKYDFDAMSRRILNLQNVQKRAKDRDGLVRLIQEMNEKTKIEYN